MRLLQSEGHKTCFYLFFVLFSAKSLPPPLHWGRGRNLTKTQAPCRPQLSPAFLVSCGAPAHLFLTHLSPWFSFQSPYVIWLSRMFFVFFQRLFIPGKLADSHLLCGCNSPVPSAVSTIPRPRPPPSTHPPVSHTLLICSFIHPLCVLSLRLGLNETKS